MASDQDVLDFLRSLFTDPGTAGALAANPGPVYAEHGVADATPHQFNQAASILATTPGALPPQMQGRLEAAISSPAGLFSDVGYRGTPPAMLASISPIAAGNIQTLAALTAATTYAPSISQSVTNVTNIDDSVHNNFTDNSIHQALTNIGGELTNEITTASGAGAVAAGPDSHVTAATGGGIAIGENADVDHTVISGGPITDSTVLGGDNNASISGHDKILGSHNITDAGLTGSSVDSVGTTNTGASQGSILAGGGSPVNVDSPGAAAAADGGQAATGGGAPGAEGGRVDGGGNTLQVGGTNVSATGSEGVNTAGAGGDANQINQQQADFGAGAPSGSPDSPVGGGQFQSAEIHPGGDGPVYFDDSGAADTSLPAPEDPSVHDQLADMSPAPSDQPAGSEHTDPLG